LRFEIKHQHSERFNYKNKKNLYDKYGITDNTDSREVQEKIHQEMMIKQKLREVVRINVNICDILDGFNKDIKIKREIINSRTRKQTFEHLDIKIKFDKSDPFNKPLIFENKGKKYDDVYGDLYILLNVDNDSTYKINKSNNNLITTQKITFAQSLCGFELSIPYGKSKPIIIQYESIIKPNTVYKIPNMGLNIIDDNDILSKSDIEIHFDIKYNLTPELIEKLKPILNYTYTKSDKLLNPNIIPIIEIEESNNTQDIQTVFEGIPGFGGGIPGFGGGIPGFGNFPPGFGGMHPGMNMHGSPGQSVHECHTS
jgi:DnaJ-class molecular chaperone